jgi:hypothetical protein
MISTAPAVRKHLREFTACSLDEKATLILVPLSYTRRVSNYVNAARNTWQALNISTLVTLGTSTFIHPAFTE